MGQPCGFQVAGAVGPPEGEPPAPRVVALDFAPSVRAAAGWGGQAPVAFPYGNRFCMGLLYGRAGRLTAENGGGSPNTTSRDI